MHFKAVILNTQEKKNLGSVQNYNNNSNNFIVVKPL